MLIDFKQRPCSIQHMDDEIFSTSEVGRCVGSSFRQIDHLMRTKDLPLRLMRERGSGKHRVWTTYEVWMAGVLADLLRQKAPLGFLPHVWTRLAEMHLRRDDERWLSLDTTTGEVRIHRAPRSTTGVWWVSLGGAIDPVERERRVVLKRRQ